MSEIKRFFVERKADFREENTALLQSLVRDLGLSTLEDVRIIRRYDLDLDESFDTKKIGDLVLSEPRVDQIYAETLPAEYDGKTTPRCPSRCLVSTISARQLRAVHRGCDWRASCRQDGGGLRAFRRALCRGCRCC